MAAPRNRRHIMIPDAPSVEKYRVHGHPFSSQKSSGPPNRPAHGKKLKQLFKRAAAEAKRHRDATDSGSDVQSAAPGFYVTFESRPGISLDLASLEFMRSGIELVSVRTQTTDDEPAPEVIQKATVLVPCGKVEHFIKRFKKYANPAPKRKGERRHESMLDPVATLSLATLRGLWTDNLDAYPDDDETIWWEVWLRRHDAGELDRLKEFARLNSVDSGQQIDVAERHLQFDDRIVVLVRATPIQLSASVHVLNDLAEVRRAKETTAVFVDMSPIEQSTQARNLLERISGPDGDAPAACMLDTGITQSHPLLENAAAAEDCTAVEPDWGADDHDGHGTEMAGLALFGDLAPVLAGSKPVHLVHRLESVKILPPSPHPQNKPELYGAITAEATSRAEVQAPLRRRCFAMAVTAPDKRDRGQPTSWSSAVDALAAGRAFDLSTQGLIYIDDDDKRKRRLFVLSAGNVQCMSPAEFHLDRSDSEPVHDPAQAWNALTVGAFTEYDQINDPTFQGWEAVAAAGDLSPWSTTSVVFAKPWPLKPDVVLEGGNAVRNKQIEVAPSDEFSLLTTYYKPFEKLFETTRATSAASAQAARMAAIIGAQYPKLWPEAIRGLIVHSAKWTQTMKKHLKGNDGKHQRENLLRRYGFGVPDLSCALRSANDSLTLIAQNSIRPFAPGADASSRQMGDIHFFELPWPKNVLQELGEQPVRLRVTLSYFIEPNPGRRGWEKRYRYASHGLRFDVKDPTEANDEFRKRLNKNALEGTERKPKLSSSNNWYFGTNARNRGSIHSDILASSAADLAARGVVAVYPVSGWWKDQPKRDRSNRGAHYALIVSIETDAANVDIWTPVANEVGLPIAIEVEV